MNWLSLLDEVVAARLCLTLLHSLWQATAIALVVRCFDALLPKSSLERRYAMHVAALLLAIVTMPVTYWMVTPSQLAGKASAFPANAEETASLSSQVSESIAASDDAFPAVTALVAPAAVTRDDRLPAVKMEPTVSTGINADSERWVTLAPWLACAYLLGVAGMFARLLAATIGAHRLVARSRLVAEGPLVESLRALARQWSMKAAPALAYAEQIVTPKVVGLARPTILLPASALTGLSPLELQMILAHELAHVRRFDLWINLLQRLAEAVLFFHPAIWLLSRRVSVLREYCCDELSCQSQAVPQGESRVRYAMALVRLLELTRPAAGSLDDLAALAASGRSPSEMRRRVARLFGEPLGEPLQLTRGGIVLLMALAAVLFVGPTTLRSRADAAAEEAKEAANPREFHLTVVGPDQKPIAGAEVEFRVRPLPREEQITRGTFVRQAKYGTIATTDAEGRLSVDLMGDPKTFDAAITKPGFAPYWAQWTSEVHPEKRPREFTAELDAGWTVGGVVVDEAGKPIEGVEIHPSVRWKKRPGDNSELYVGGGAKTAADGSWRYEHVPGDKAEVHVTIDHPDYAPVRRSLPRKGFEVAVGQTPNHFIEMTRGLTVIGRVTNDRGEPIAGALVRTKFSNNERQATTDADGRYRLEGCEPRMTRIVVSAKGQATDMQETAVARNMPPIDFVMQPGGRVRVRVVDEAGKGIPKARIFFQRWRGMFQYFEFDHVNQYANEEGVWEWNEAPLDEFEADICRPAGMQLSRQKLSAGGKYIFQPPPALVVSGRVVDAETEKPIAKFRVVPGSLGADAKPFWLHNAYEAVDGDYRVRFTRTEPGHVVRIEAEGYQVATSREIESDEGPITIDFELRRAESLAATIVTPERAPAAGTDIAVGVIGAQISIRNGRFDRQTYADRLTADKEGRFSVPARKEAFHLVMLHESGFAHWKSSDGPLPERVTLTPWARLEGTFRVGSQLAPGAPLSISTSAINSYDSDAPRIFSRYDVTTGEAGRFTFERVFPGQGHIGRDITWMVNEGATEVTSSVMTFKRFPAGETTRVDLGGDGRPVVGHLVAPNRTTGQVLWNLARVRAAVEPPDLKMPVEPTPPADVSGDAAALSAWWKRWLETDEGQAWRGAYETYEAKQAQLPRITCSVGGDGRFRIDDVPPGAYVLKVSGMENGAPGSLDGVRFTVPPVEPGTTVEPVDLGRLKLNKN